MNRDDKDADFLEGLTKRDILRRYSTFEDLVISLESGYDLEAAGECDSITQANYLLLESMKATDLFYNYNLAKKYKFLCESCSQIYPESEQNEVKSQGEVFCPSCYTEWENDNRS